MKVNCDVGFINADSYQVVAVARNADGICIWLRVCKLVGQPPAAMDETRALLEGIKMAKEKGWPEVEFEGDSRHVMEEMGKGIVDPFSHYGHLGSSIVALLKLLDDCQCPKLEI